MCGLQTFLGQMTEMRKYSAAPMIIKRTAHILRSLRSSSSITVTLINDPNEGLMIQVRTIYHSV